MKWTHVWRTPVVLSNHIVYSDAVGCFIVYIEVKIAVVWLSRGVSVYLVVRHLVHLWNNRCSFGYPMCGAGFNQSMKYDGEWWKTRKNIGEPNILGKKGHGVSSILMCGQVLMWWVMSSVPCLCFFHYVEDILAASSFVYTQKSYLLCSSVVMLHRSFHRLFTKNSRGDFPVWRFVSISRGCAR